MEKDRSFAVQLTEDIVEDAAETARDPQVTSNDPLERKLARRLRIQKKQEIVKKHRGDGDIQFEEEEAPKSLLEQRILDGMVNLNKLILDGHEQVTNVRVATDAREVKRRQNQSEARIARIKMIENEAEESLETLEEINETWKQISKSNDPLDIYNDMEKQKLKCDELLKRKNEIIEELNKELEKNDEQFRRDQRKQKDDLNLLAERIDNHIDMMQKAYRQELQLLEEAIKIEHDEMVETSNKEWEELYKERDKEEVVNIKKKLDLILDYEKEVDTMHIEHQEKFREAKIRLESDIHVLQQEVEKIKALCLLNSEKLDYNFQILKKRDDENLLMKAHQKRRINKLQDVINNLRVKIEEAEKTTKIERQRLTDEVLKLHKNIIEIGHKADHFAKVNDRKYNKVWEMNDKMAQELLEKILTADRIIHEQQLGLEWQPPTLTVMNKNELPSYNSAMKAVDQLFKKKDEMLNAETGLCCIGDLKAIKSKESLLRHILQKIADNSGFLVEEKIRGLLFPYRKTEKTLVKVENVFQALGILTEEHMNIMKEYFIPYLSCDECGYSPSQVPSEKMLNDATGDTQEKLSEKSSEIISYESEDGEKAKDEIDLFTSLHRGMGMSPISSVKNDDETDGSEENGTEGSGSAASPPVTPLAVEQAEKSAEVRKHCNSSHTQKINSVYVLKALRAFITDFSKSKEIITESMSERLAKERRTVSRSLKADDVTAYWNRYTQIFGPEREKVWDALMIGLHKFHDILQERHKLNEEVQSLRLQNNELKRLLQQYMTTYGQSMKRTLPPLRTGNQKKHSCRYNGKHPY